MNLQRGACPASLKAASNSSEDDTWTGWPGNPDPLLLARFSTAMTTCLCTVLSDRKIPEEQDVFVLVLGEDFGALLVKTPSISS